MINHCKNNNLSVCDMSTLHTEQRKCRHYAKATRYERCMFLIFDEYCGCLRAQQDSCGFFSDKEIAEIESNKNKFKKSSIFG